MRLSESQAAAHPILAADKVVRRKEIARALGAALLVFAVVAGIASLVLVDGLGGHLLVGH